MLNDRSFRFRRFGTSYHLVIKTADDLERVLELDDALWVATSAPLDGLLCDSVFLSMIEQRIDGRIICDEMRDAIRWTLDVLRDRKGIERHDTALQLGAIDSDHEDGRRALEAANKILARNGTSGDQSTTLEQVRQIKHEVESRPVSEAGVVLPDAADDEEIHQFLNDIVMATGGSAHPSGAKGITLANLDQFLAESRAYLDWHARGQVSDDQPTTPVQPLGEQTAEAFAALRAVRDKIDQYFAQCRAVAHDPDLASRFGPKSDVLDALDPQDPASIDAILHQSPLAPASPERVLDLTGRINPAYTDAVTRAVTEALQPALGEAPSNLTEAKWHEVKQFYAAHGAWSAGPAGREVGRLGLDKLDAYLDERFAGAVRQLETESHATAFDLKNVRVLEKLILFQANLIPVANNFVSFPDLYETTRRAMFELGSLIMDGRRFNLAVRVTNRAEHSRVAANSGMYVMYLEVSPSDGAPRYEVAVPVTSGTKGSLAVGKRGVFNDLRGHLCDARVVQIIDNPVSMGEAIIAPFQRIGRLLTGKFEALTGAAEKRLDATTASAMTRVETTVTDTSAAPAPPAPPADRGPSGMMAGGMLMGGGVAVAALGTAAAYITKTLAGLGPRNILIGVAMAIIAVLLPTAIMAHLKLRKRDLAAILEGSGWAINARMRLTRTQGRFFAQRPDRPDGSLGLERWRRWLHIAIAIVIVIALGFGIVQLGRHLTTKGAQGTVEHQKNEQTEGSDKEGEPDTP